MSETRFYLFTFGVILTIALVCSSFFAGIQFANSRNNDKKQQVITSQTVFDRIQENSFLVSQTAYVDQESELNVDQGSGWSNFWWGEKIMASGLVRIDVGVNLKDLEVSDITVDDVNKKIKVKLPKSTILDANVSGDIEVKTSKGVLRFLFKNDSNKDHNLATQILVDEAKKSVETDEELLKKAGDDALKTIEKLFDGVGYEVEVVTEE